MGEEDSIDKKDKLALMEFYSNQRDSQLKQLMAVNGQGTFSIIAALAAILIGVLSKKEWSGTPSVGIGIFLVGILLLLIAAAKFSITYNKRIQKFEELVRNPKEIAELDQDIFVIRPNNTGNYLVFIGVSILLIGTLLVITNGNSF